MEKEKFVVLVVRIAAWLLHGTAKYSVGSAQQNAAIGICIQSAQKRHCHPWHQKSSDFEKCALATGKVRGAQSPRLYSIAKLAMQN